MELVTVMKRADTNKYRLCYEQSSSSIEVYLLSIEELKITFPRYYKHKHAGTHAHTQTHTTHKRARILIYCVRAILISSI